MSDVNLKEEFEKRAAQLGDVIKEAVVGRDDRVAFGDQPDYDTVYQPELWETAAAKLDYKYYNGYGGADCHSVVAWGEKYIYYVHEYDGATSVCALPRNPTTCANYWGDVI